MQDVSIEALKNLVSNSTDDTLQSWETHDIKVPFDLTSKDFLAFAQCDLRGEYGHRLVNGLSNIKRAINCQLDSLLVGFGLFQLSRKGNWGFPYKAEQLNKVGIISPSILRKINQKRNLLEHEYRKPEAEQVEDALDVATLFVTYTNRFLYNALIECELFDQDRNDLTVRLSYEQNRIVLSGREWSESDADGPAITKVLKEVTADSEEYLDYLGWFISLYELRR